MKPEDIKICVTYEGRPGRHSGKRVRRSVVAVDVCFTDYTDVRGRKWCSTTSAFAKWADRIAED